MKQVQRPNMSLEVLFWNILEIQIQIYPQTSIEPKFVEFYLHNDVAGPGPSS